MIKLDNWILPFAITVIYTAATIIIGTLPSRKIDMNKHENWGVSGNTMGTLLLIFLLGGSEISAYTFMGAPGWSYSKGVGILYVSVYLALMQIVGYFINPRIVRLSKEKKIMTQPSAFGKRYESRFVQALGCLGGSITMVCYCVVQIVGCGYIINVMSGNTIPVWLAEVLILLVIFAYVYKAGLASAGWVSVMQGVLMFIVALTTAALLCKQFTGSIFWGATFEKIAEVSPAHLTLPGALGDFSPTVWTTSILVSVLSVWPSFWIAASGGKSEDDCRKATSLIPIYQLVMLPMMIVGFICVFAMEGYEGPIDKAGLTLALNNLPWWISGLLGAGTLAAAQSSAAPLVQALAFSWTNDILVPYGVVKEEKRAKVQRLMLLPVMFLIVLPLSIMNPASLVQLLLIGYGFLAQILPLCIGVFIWPRSTKFGAVTGLVVGLIVVVVFSFVIPNPLGVHAGIWGLIANIPVHIIVSLATKPESKETMQLFFQEDLVNELYE
jgi:SSS family solute:Na+ symporter